MKQPCFVPLLAVLVASIGLGIGAWAAAPVTPPAGRSITDHAVEWPSVERLRRTLALADYNTRVVFAGVTALGAVGGLVGTFLLLRKRSLLSDTVSHCTLPGLALAFLVAEALGGSGRSLPVLLAGAAVTGVLGMVLVAVVRANSRVKDDAALAIVLSVFFGLGVALLVVVQQLPTGNAAGLKNYIYGKAAAMTAADARLILFASVAVALVCAALFKEFKLLCFDGTFARTQGWPVLALDLGLMGLVVAVTVIGLQAVGLLLVVSLLIIPPAAARFWSHRLGPTVALATVIGAISGFCGVAVSALFSRLPAGAVIVLSAVALFGVSFVFGARRGLLVRWLERRRTERRVARLHLLRALYEHGEASRVGTGATTDTVAFLDRPVALADLRASNGWSSARLQSLLRLGRDEGLITVDAAAGRCQLTADGKLEARRVTRNHRLWETYLLHHADVAPQHIHHNADQIEHVIEPNIVNELEELLAGRGAG
ncbi:MAG TPA: metal ABC transporter permease, partial [Methylomirabilota bacterium]|nr:metal ABC transporter permease [Methylomirabilota bacterium]